MKEYSLTVAAQVENEKANKAHQRELEKSTRGEKFSTSAANTHQSHKNELLMGLAEGVLQKKLRKAILICKCFLAKRRVGG